jgi:hypothetical protein
VSDKALVIFRLEQFLDANLGDDSETQAIRLMALADIDLIHYLIALGLTTVKRGGIR